MSRSGSQILTGDEALAMWKTEEHLKNLRKELELFLKFITCGCGRAGAVSIKEKTIIALNPFVFTELPDNVSGKMMEWFKDFQTQHEFLTWLVNNNHLVDGSEGNWSVGQFGSRWCDKKFNGRYCRIAFYSKKNDEGGWFRDPTKNYAIIIDPY
jgi:hypothetical protein